MIHLRVWAKSHQSDLLSLAALTAVVVLLWIPFGWNVSGLTDEWVFISNIQRGDPITDLAGIRPFTLTGLALAHWLTPDSFVGLNLLFAALLLARAFALYLLVRELVRGAPGLATGVSLLYVVFYGDLGWFWLTTFNIGWSVLWTFVAVWLLLRQLRQPVRWLWLAVAGAQYLAMSYEGAFPIIFAAPLLLPLVAERLNRRVLLTAAWWYLVPFLLLVRYVLIVTGESQAYQSAQYSIALGSESPLRDMANSLLRAYQHLLGGAFLNRYRDWRETLPTVPYALAIAAISFSTLWYSLRQMPLVLRWREIITAAAAGFALIGLGFASYLVSEFRDVDYRVYYFSAAGAALLFITTLFAVSYGGKWARRAAATVAGVLVLIIAPRLGKLALAIGAILTLLVPERWLFLLGITALIGVHASFTLWQHRLYAEAPQGQHWILSAMIEQAPRPADGTMLVLLDESSDRRALLEFENRRDMLIGAVRYLYSNSTLDAAFCVPDTETFGYFQESCAFATDGFQTSYSAFGVERGRAVPYENLLVFAFDDEEGARLLTELPAPASDYDPLAIAGQGEPLPSRVESALYDFPTPKPPRPIRWPLLH